MKQEYDFSKGETGKFFHEDATRFLTVNAHKESPIWAGPDGDLGVYITGESQKTLDAYGLQPNLVDEHANHEEDTARGGYAHRQLFELVQNSADALAGIADGGRIAIRLTETCLYCADNGDPIDSDGVRALMFSHVSPKRGTREIGRYGLGFKSVLGVTDAPEFFSHSGSFRFDRHDSSERIRQTVPDSERYPVLRLPTPINPRQNQEKNQVLGELMDWATNIVRLPLKDGVHENLRKQIEGFPPEFLLFVEHVRELSFKDSLSRLDRLLELEKVDGEYVLSDGDKRRRWKLFKDTHWLSSNARADRRSLDDDNEVPIWWAAPLDRLSDPGHFWAFFPTMTTSLVSGILNAPWKTNEDRQNLLPGPYNDELIEAAAEMVADLLPELATEADPARHLDALPRRREAGDSEQVELLRKCLFFNLQEREIVPDQNGDLRTIGEISYPPEALTEDRQMSLAPFEKWAAYPGRPVDWLHHRALGRERLSRIDRLFHQESWTPKRGISGMPRTTIAEWLRALVEHKRSDNAVQASMTAIQTAALISPQIRSNNKLGAIVLTASGGWRAPDPESVFLPDEMLNDGPTLKLGSFVHPKVASDGATCKALAALGIKPVSPKSRFELVLKRVMARNKEQGEDVFKEFWLLARQLDAKVVHALIQEYKGWQIKLYVRTQSGSWQPLDSVLLPGRIAPGHNLRDAEVAVDMEFHYADENLLEMLGVVDAPCEGRDLTLDRWFFYSLSECRYKFKAPDRNLSRNPRRDSLNFASTVGTGPLQILTILSEEGKVLYTDAMLSLDTTYEQWTMGHDTQEVYPEMRCESPAIRMLRIFGRIRTSDAIVPFTDALGQQPKNPAALYTLLAHPKAAKIITVFGLKPPTPEFIGDEDPIFLTDEWPGLGKYLPAHQRNGQLIRCEQILLGGSAPQCVFHASNIYLTRTGDDDRSHALRLVNESLNLELSEPELEKILEHKTAPPPNPRSTDAERLLAAVGEQALRQGLPDSLLDILEADGVRLTGTKIAEAAIAVYHSDALRQYRWALDRLDPPQRWAGSARAVAFVHSLGFSAAWAGERNRRREPYLEVEGPYSLPELHDYQKAIVAKVRDMLRNGHLDGAKRRGMISLPTGSGKTRVAVQAIIELMRDDGFNGGILWVADRDELCEQAVEAWRQVWSSIGADAARLRISRMWAGQPSPLPTSDLHVVVATIQTLNAKLSNGTGEYRFLTDFKLVVFDEAHRSIAPTFTSVMHEIGLTHRKKMDEPFLLGLTATPYRGHNEEETAWLVRRYGGNRLDSGAFASNDPQDVIYELQNMRVLARADHETIEGGRFSLNIDELGQMQKLSVPWLPQSMENRIARDAERTKRIIEAHKKYVDPNWPSLIFATSVEHAQTVAALLNGKNIKSRAVSGTTEPSTRRRVVEEFRRGEIKALVNYGVFREGFDAPKTRAIIVARPVYSPNLYFQMIGRGLRGVRNGGNDRCLVLNVRDNIENFQRQLAFSDLDWLWA